LELINFRFFQIALNVLAVNIIIASVDPWILIPTFVIASMFYGCDDYVYC